MLIDGRRLLRLVEHKGRESWVLAEEVEIHIYDLRDSLLQGLPRTTDGRKALDDELNFLTVYPFEELFLSPIVIVYHRRVASCLLSDLNCRRLHETLINKQFFCRFQDGLLHVLLLYLHNQSSYLTAKLNRSMKTERNGTIFRREGLNEPRFGAAMT